MRNLLAIGIVGFLAGTAYVCVGSQASYESQTPSASVISAALRSQLSEPLEVSYTLIASSTKSETQPLSTTYRYVRTQGILFEQESTSGGRVTGQFSYDRQKSEYRKLFTPASGGASGEVDDRIGRPFYSRHQMETALYCDMEGRPLVELVALGAVRGEPEEIEGHKCWRVEAPSALDSIDKYIVWVDQEIGFCPRRMQICWKGEAVTNSITDFLDYTEVKEGVWFPMVLSSTCEDSRFGKTVNTCKVQEIKSCVIESKEALRVAFPSGTEVFDRHLDATYTER